MWKAIFVKIQLNILSPICIEKTFLSIKLSYCKALLHLPVVFRSNQRGGKNNIKFKISLLQKKTRLRNHPVLTLFVHLFLFPEIFAGFGLFRLLAPDMRTNAAKLLHQMVIAAVDVFHTGDFRDTTCDQSGDNQRSPGAKVGRPDSGPFEMR